MCLTTRSPDSFQDSFHSTGRPHCGRRNHEVVLVVPRANFGGCRFDRIGRSFFYTDDHSYVSSAFHGTHASAQQPRMDADTHYC